jgi:WD40 repeat protein
VYDVARGRELHQFPGHRSGPLTVAFAPDGKTVITADPPAFSQPVQGWADWSFRVWDPATGKELRVTQVDPGGEVRLVVISPDTRLIAVVTHEGTIHLWDVATGKEVQRWKGPTREVKWQVGREWKTADYTSVQQAMFSPDGKTFMIPGRESVLDRWDTATGKELPPLKVASLRGPSGCFLSPDGRTLLVPTSDPSPAIVAYYLHLLDTASGRSLREMDTSGKGLFQTPINEAVASADGRTWAVLTWLDGPAVVLFEAATGQKRGLLEPGRHRVRTLAFSPDGRFLATGGEELRLWDLATSRTAALAARPGGQDVTSLAFSPDGKRLAVGGYDSAALVYDVAELLKGKGPAPAKPSADELEGLWKDLSGADAARSYQAIHRLAAAPESVSFLKDRLKATPGPDEKRLARLIADLDRDDPEVREKATAELERLGAQAEPALRRALEGQPSAEVRMRVGHLLEKFKPGRLPSAELIRLRALEALEMAGTPEARQVIKGLAGGPADASLTREAKAALERLTARGE